MEILSSSTQKLVLDKKVLEAVQKLLNDASDKAEPAPEIVSLQSEAESVELRRVPSTSTVSGPQG